MPKCATEDSWEHTIVPRLMASGADRSRVFRVEVMTAENIQVGLTLPRDLVELERVVREEWRRRGRSWACRCTCRAAHHGSPVPPGCSRGSTCRAPRGRPAAPGCR